MRQRQPSMRSDSIHWLDGDSEKYTVDKMVRGFRHPTLSRAIHYFF